VSRFWVAVIAGGGGIVVGLWLAKQYAKSEVTDTIHSALGSVGLAGGTVEKIADAIVIPQVG
jgi:hypothetical protein